MQKRSLIVLSAGVILAGTATWLAPAAAQQWLANEAEMIGLRQLCWTGHRNACIRFGMVLGANRERQKEWRRLHPDWWEWER